MLAAPASSSALAAQTSSPVSTASSPENVAVAVRVRPLNAREVEAGHQVAWRLVEGNTLVHLQSQPGELLQASSNTVAPPTAPPVSFTFDHIFTGDCTNKAIYADFGMHIVSSAMEGVNGTIFAYGQTASGKTFTMNGTADDHGIVLLSIKDIFKYVRNDVAGCQRAWLIRMSYVEIYNELIKDLLSGVDNLRIHEDTNGSIFVGHVTEETCTDPKQVLSLIFKAQSNRVTGTTNMNERSSRSHTILTFTIESREYEVDSDGEQRFGAIRTSKLNLVDLAGSERISTTGAEGIRLKEGGHINKSLLTLGTVIGKLSDSKENAHIPYRDSKLTRILQPSLGGNARTGIICTVTPSSRFIDETTSTLKFASRAKQIKNKPMVNEIVTDKTRMKRMQEELDELKTQLKLTKDASQRQEGLQRAIASIKETLENNNDVFKPSKRARETRRQTWMAGQPDLSNLDISGDDNDDNTNTSNKKLRLEKGRASTSIRRYSERTDFNFKPQTILHNDNNNDTDVSNREPSLLLEISQQQATITTTQVAVNTDIQDISEKLLQIQQERDNLILRLSEMESTLSVNQNNERCDQAVQTIETTTNDEQINDVQSPLLDNIEEQQQQQQQVIVKGQQIAETEQLLVQYNNLLDTLQSTSLATLLNADQTIEELQPLRADVFAFKSKSDLNLHAFKRKLTLTAELQQFCDIESNFMQRQFKNEIYEMQEKMSAAAKDYEKRISDLNTAVTDYATISTELDLARLTVIDLNAHMVSSAAERETLANEKAKLEQDNERLYTRLETLQAELSDRTKVQVETQNQLVKTHEMAQQQLEEQVRVLETQKGALEADLAEANQRGQMHTEELQAALATRMQGLEHQIDSLLQERAELLNQLRSLQDEQSANAEEEYALKLAQTDEHKLLNNAKEQLITKNMQLRDQISVADALVTSLRNEVQAAQAHSQQIESEESEERQERETQLLDQLKKAELTIERLNDQYAKADDALRKVEKEFELCNGDLQQLRELNATLNSTYKPLHADLFNVTLQLQELQEQYTQMQTLNATMETDSITLKSSLAEAQAEAEAQSNRATALQLQLQEFKGKLESIEAELITQQRENADLMESNDRQAEMIQDVDGELHAISSEHKALQGKVADMIQELKLRDDQQSAIDKEQEGAREQLARLQHELTQSCEKLMAAVADRDSAHYNIKTERHLWNERQNMLTTQISEMEVELESRAIELTMIQEQHEILTRQNAEQEQRVIFANEAKTKVQTELLQSTQLIQEYVQLMEDQSNELQHTLDEKTTLERTCANLTLRLDNLATLLHQQKSDVNQLPQEQQHDDLAMVSRLQERVHELESKLSKQQEAQQTEIDNKFALKKALQTVADLEGKVSELTENTIIVEQKLQKSSHEKSELDEAATLLQNQLIDLQSAMTTRQDQLDVLRDQVRTLTEDRRRIEAKCENIQNTVIEKESLAEEYLQMQQLMSSRVQQLELDGAEKDSIVLGLRTEVQQLNEDVKCLNEQLLTLETSSADIQQRAEDTQRKANETQEAIQHEKEIFTTLKLSLEAQTAMHREKAEGIERSFVELTTDYKTLQDILSLAEERNATTERTLIDLDHKLRKTESLVKEYEVRIQIFSTESQNHHTAHAELLEQINKLKKEALSISNENSDNSQLLELQQKVAHADVNRQAMEETLRKLSQHIEDLEMEAIKHGEHAQLLERTLKENEIRVHELQSDLQSTRELQQQGSEEANNELQRYKSMVDPLELQIRQQKALISMKQSENQTFSTQLTQLTNEIGRIKAAHEDAITELARHKVSPATPVKPAATVDDGVPTSVKSLMAQSSMHSRENVLQPSAQSVHIKQHQRTGRVMQSASNIAPLSAASGLNGSKLRQALAASARLGKPALNDATTPECTQQ